MSPREGAQAEFIALGNIVPKGQLKVANVRTTGAPRRRAIHSDARSPIESRQILDIQRVGSPLGLGEFGLTGMSVIAPMNSVRGLEETV